MNKLYWFEFRDHLTRKKPWRVFLVDALENHVLGLCDSSVREIYILARFNRKRSLEVLGHEVLHAACGHVSHQTDLEHHGEEYTALKVETTMIPIIKSFGGKVPPFPRGLRAFRKQAS